MLVLGLVVFWSFLLFCWFVREVLLFGLLFVVVCYSGLLDCRVGLDLDCGVWRLGWFDLICRWAFVVLADFWF